MATAKLLDTIIQAPVCERCKAVCEGQYCLVMSYFNTQMVCEHCERLEQGHGKYSEARKAEIDAIKSGNWNFKGIGLPDSLKA